MDSLPKLINQYPELLNVSKPSLKNTIFYNENKYNSHFIESLISIYKFYFEINPLLVIPKYFKSYHQEAFLGDLESLENLKENKIIIFAYADILFNDIIKINKRRLNTIIKNCSKKSKVIILSITNLKSLELSILETFHLEKMNLEKLKSNKIKNLNVSLFDLFDPDPDIFKSNTESFVEMLNDFKDKKVYISLNLNTNKILYIESKLKEIFKVFRKEPEENLVVTNGVIVINKSKTTQQTLLKYDYDIYIFVLPIDLEYLDILYYFKDIFSEKQKEIYIDSSNNDNVEESLMKIYKQSFDKMNVRDSKEDYDTFESIKLENKENAILATDDYYAFESPESIQNMDLRNLSKKDYDTIRNYIKLKLNCKFELNVKTCQLSTPCSPKDRSRKLNSLSNKISSTDYRCDVTCEIFKDYTIGVIIWNEIFNSKEKINILKSDVYIYQTTYGKWKYTEVY